MDRPDVQGRVSILKVHARGKVLGKDVDLDKVARRTPGFTGADLQNLMNEAAILAARRGLQEISKDEIADALERIIAGPEKKGAVMSDKKRRLVAYHEAGHALVGALMPDYDPVTKISIVPRGAAGGLTFFAPSEERLESGLYSRTYFENQMAVALGGRIAEELIFGEDDITTGALMLRGWWLSVGRASRAGLCWGGGSRVARISRGVPKARGAARLLGRSRGRQRLFCAGLRNLATLRNLAAPLTPLVTRPPSPAGASGDFQQVTRTARLMVTQLGFSKKLGQVAWSSGGGQSFLGQSMAQPSDFSSQTADEIDQEVKELVERAYRRAKDLIQSNIEVLHKVAAVLIEKENIDGDEFQQIVLESQAEQYLRADAPGVTIPYQAA